nr:MAG: hypothetical protein DIU57_13660 [Pseudomonadota bacterium]
MESTLDQHALAARFGVTTRTLRTWIRNGELPPPHRIGRKQFWFEDEIQAWLRSRPTRQDYRRAAHPYAGVRRGRPRYPT